MLIELLYFRPDRHNATYLTKTKVAVTGAGMIWCRLYIPGVVAETLGPYPVEPDWVAALAKKLQSDFTRYFPANFDTIRAMLVNLHLDSLNGTAPRSHFRKYAYPTILTSNL